MSPQDALAESLRGTIVCDACGEWLAAHNDDLGPAQIERLRRHPDECEEYKARRKRIRRNQESGWWAGSYSSIATYDDCPLKYKFQIDSKYMSTSDPAQLGRALHAESAGESPKDVPVDRMRKFLELSGTFEKAIDMPEDAQSEKELFVDWWVHEALRAEIRCFLDKFWIDWKRGVAYCIDYKSGRLNNDEVRQKWAVQRLLYAFAIARNVPGCWKVVSWTVHIQSESVLPYPNGEAIRLTDIEEFGELLQQKVAAIATDLRHRPNPGTHCRWCDFVTKCPAAQERLSDVQLEVNTVKGGKVKIDIPRNVKEDPQALKKLEEANYPLSRLSKEIKDTIKAVKGE